MLLEGSCHCGAVRFKVESKTPHPYMRCYCSVCRKTAGGGGYAINLMGDAQSLRVEGSEAITVYHAVIDGERSPAERRFCNRCGSALWLWDPRWPELIHPHASAIDTDLPVPPERVHILLDDKASWVEPDVRQFDTAFSGYPDESIADWHANRGLTLKD